MTDDRKTLSLGEKERQVRKEETSERVARPDENKARDEQIRTAVKKTRRSKMDHVDELYVDPASVPDGFTVEWKRYSTYGKVDNLYLMTLANDGWEPASPKDFPQLVGPFHKDATIIIKDLILMIRPVELSVEARKEERVKATSQVRDKFEEIGMAKPGELPREDSAGRKLTKIQQTYERIPVGD